MKNSSETLNLALAAGNAAALPGPDEAPASLAPSDISPASAFDLLSDQSPALEFLKDETGRLVYYNKAFGNVFGVAGWELLGKRDSEWLPELTASSVRLRDQTVLETGAVAQVEETWPTPLGVRRWLVLRFPLRDAAGRCLLGAVALDITERWTTDRIADPGPHDPLTRLPNLTFLIERLQVCLAKARRTNKRMAVLYLDIDRFKLVNDGLGHAAGSAVLQELARRLAACMREADTVARVGGDEFVVLVPEIAGAEDAGAVARKLLESIAEPLCLGGRRVDLTTSVGVSVWPDDGEDAESLLRSADNAMYRAKELGRNNYQLCTPELGEETVKRLNLQVGLRRAIDRDELVLHYQPVLSLTTGRVVEFEALVRWQHPQRGLIMPGDFIGLAEKAGMMVPLGQWVLGHASRQLKVWQDRDFPDLRVAVNLSPSQFHERNLVPTIENALTESALKPETLEIEITEGVAMEDAEVTVANLMALRDLKVGISIDDFGTGYSSLSYLKKFPVTTLKIDRSFVSDVVTNPADAGIVRAIVAMAHGMNLKVIAEGVETKEQFAYLKEHGCDALQGYWFSRPLSVQAADALLAEERERWNPRH